MAPTRPHEQVCVPTSDQEWITVAALLEQLAAVIRHAIDHEDRVPGVRIAAALRLSAFDQVMVAAALAEASRVGQGVQRRGDSTA